MEVIFKTILALHIIGGSIGLTAGTVNMFRPKGDKIHKLAGRFFLYGMLTAGTAALVLAAMHPNYFLFIVGVFTIYMVSTGDRSLALKDLGKGQKPKTIDWMLTGAMALFGAAFIAFGAFKLFHGNTFGPVFIVFGFISLSMVRGDINHYQDKTGLKNPWLTIHLQRMMGAYIASATAFLVVNFPKHLFTDNLSFIPWLLPTAIITPLIFKWTAKYRVKKS